MHANSLAQAADGGRAETRRSSRSCATRRSCPRPSRSTTCSPTCSASAARWRSSSTSTAARPASSRRGHRRGGRRRDRRRDRPGRRRGAPAGRTATGSCAATSPSPISQDYGLDAAGRHRRLQLGRRLRLRRARPAAEARRHDRRQRLLDPRRVGAREPHRGGADLASVARRARLSRAAKPPHARPSTSHESLTTRYRAGTAAVAAPHAGGWRRRGQFGGPGGSAVPERRSRPAGDGPASCFWEEVLL